jgi:hypothetical protein
VILAEPPCRSSVRIDQNTQTTKCSYGMLVLTPDLPRGLAPDERPVLQHRSVICVSDVAVPTTFSAVSSFAGLSVFYQKLNTSYSNWPYSWDFSHGYGARSGMTLVFEVGNLARPPERLCDHGDRPQSAPVRQAPGGIRWPTQDAGDAGVLIGHSHRTALAPDRLSRRARSAAEYRAGERRRRIGGGGKAETFLEAMSLGVVSIDSRAARGKVVALSRFAA